jgi:hypothetical protein
MEDKMYKVTDFSTYTEDELRRLLIDNAKPISGGMERVTREITKKYKACDRDMLLWFINRPPYNGVLWAPDTRRVIRVEDVAKEDRRMEYEQQKAQKKRIEEQKARDRLPKPHAELTPIYVSRKLPMPPKAPKKPNIMAELKKMGCKPVLIDEKVVGIVRMGSYAAIDKIKADNPDWQVVEI